MGGMRREQAGRYDETYRRSLDDPDGFWAEAAAAIEWVEPWERVLDASRAPFFRWFTGGRLNTCHNALDRHVDGGRGEQLALIYDSPVTDTRRRFTYRELRDAVARFAGALAAEGVGRGDRVIVYMPMVPEAVIAMLACARIGAIHCVVFGGFAAHELASRIEDARPKVVVSASCGLEPGRIVAYKPLLDAAIDLVESKPERCIVLQRPQLAADLDPGRDLDWHEAAAAAPSAGSSATRTSCMRRSCTAARPCCTRASRWGPLILARSGASSPSTASRPSSPRRRRSARSGSRIRTEATSGGTTSRGSARCSSR